MRASGVRSGQPMKPSSLARWRALRERSMDCLTRSTIAHNKVRHRAAFRRLLGENWEIKKQDGTSREAQTRKDAMQLAGTTTRVFLKIESNCQQHPCCAEWYFFFLAKEYERLSRTSHIRNVSARCWTMISSVCRAVECTSSTCTSSVRLAAFSFVSDNSWFSCYDTISIEAMNIEDVFFQSNVCWANIFSSKSRM